jgi:hypothetical protein
VARTCKLRRLEAAHSSTASLRIQRSCVAWSVDRYCSHRHASSSLQTHTEESRQIIRTIARQAWMRRATAHAATDIEGVTREGSASGVGSTGNSSATPQTHNADEAFSIAEGSINDVETERPGQ